MFNTRSLLNYYKLLWNKNEVLLRSLNTVNVHEMLCCQSPSSPWGNIQSKAGLYTLEVWNFVLQTEQNCWDGFSLPKVKHDIFIFLYVSPIGHFRVADPSSMHNTTNSANMTYAHHKSPSSSVVRTSDQCTEGHGFDSGLTQSFSLSHAPDMSIIHLFVW